MKITVKQLREIIKEEVTKVFLKENSAVDWKSLGERLAEMAADYGGKQEAKLAGNQIFVFDDNSKLINSVKKSDGKRRVTTEKGETKAAKILKALSKEFGVDWYSSGNSLYLEEE